MYMKRAVVTIAGLFIYFLGAGPVHAAVVINEIRPKTSLPDYAFVELYNSGGTRVDLNQWKLENVSSPATSYILPASAIIEPNGFLVFSRPQSGIIFNIDGDTVKLTDFGGSVVDSQSYPGTLGYNNAMGRSADGTGVWTSCTEATPGRSNLCPEPSPTPTPTPTPVVPTAPSTPTTATPKQVAPTAAPTATPTPKIVSPLSTEKPLSSSRVTFGQIAGIQTESKEMIPTATPTAKIPPLLEAYHFAVEKLMLFQVIAVLVGWSVIALIAILRKNRKR